MALPLSVLVTGANSGFGRLTVEALAARGHTVFACMRDVEGRNAEAARALRDLDLEKGWKLTVLEMDVTDDASVEAAVARAQEAVGALDAVINNAGVFSAGHEETFTAEQLDRILDVNVTGPHRVNRAALPAMRKRGQGLLVHVSSGLARFLLPCVGIYSASKAALEAYAEALRYALVPLGVESTIVQPGAFPTGITEKSVYGSDTDRLETYGEAAGLPEQIASSFEQMLSGPDAPEPQLVADTLVELVESAPGTRPLRTVVDPLTGGVVEAINESTRKIQVETMREMGMEGLASATNRTV